MKGKKMLVKALAMVLAAASCFTLVACTGGGKNDYSGQTTIYVMNNGGGCGRVWLDNAIARFSETVKDKSYAEGKKGVHFEIEHNILTNTDTMATSGYDVYFTTSDGYPRGLSQKGLVLDLTDFIKEKNYDNGTVSIEDKIYEEYRNVLKGKDGKYYAIPHEEWYPGLTYDADLFKRENLYIAASDVSEDEKDVFDGEFGTLEFVADDTVKKSCGNDGVYGTYDDGLPTTLVELLVLCEKLDQLSITPFHVSGKNNQYTNYLTEALWCSLSGYDAYMGTYTFDSDMEVVTGWTGEQLFAGVEDIDVEKPETTTVKLTEKTGYLATDNVNRYYASAFLYIINKKSWYSQDTFNGNVTHTGAQENFIHSGRNNVEKVAFMIEGNYWYNESVTAENFSDFKLLYPAEPDRDLRWMALPTSFNTPVTEGNGRENVLLDTGASFTFVNKKTAEKKDGCLDALYDFLTFIYSDEEMSHFTECTGLAKAAMSYEITAEDWEKMPEFKKAVWDLRNNKVAYGTASNETFLSSPLSFVPYQCSEVNFYYTINGKLYICDLYANRAGYTGKQCFEYARKTAEQWNGIYKGND